MPSDWNSGKVYDQTDIQEELLRSKFFTFNSHEFASSNYYAKLSTWFFALRQNIFYQNANSGVLELQDVFVFYFPKFCCFRYMFCPNASFLVGSSTLVGQHPMKSLSFVVCPSVRPSVTKFSQD